MVTLFDLSMEKFKGDFIVNQKVCMRIIKLQANLLCCGGARPAAYRLRAQLGTVQCAARCCHQLLRCHQLLLLPPLQNHRQTIEMFRR